LELTLRKREKVFYSDAGEGRNHMKGGAQFTYSKTEEMHRMIPGKLHCGGRGLRKRWPRAARS